MGWNEVDNHQLSYGYKKFPCCGIEIYDIDRLSLPNKFWYAFPYGMVNESEVPKYAGIIAVSERGEGKTPSITMVREAPFVHRKKLNLESLLFDKYRWHRESLLRENESLKRALKRMTEIKEALNPVNLIT